MTYTLFGDRGSGSSIVECALAELGVPYEVSEVSLDTDTQRAQTYAAINPQRKIPALRTPAGETLTESVAILLTLDERHGGALLPPPGSPDRAVALRWLMFMATEVYPLVEILDYPARFSPDGADTEAVRATVSELWRARLSIVEGRIAGDPWLLPAGYCITDAYIAVVSRWGRQDAWRPDNVPRIERVAAAMAEREVTAAVWAHHFGGA